MEWKGKEKKRRKRVVVLVLVRDMLHRDSFYPAIPMYRIVDLGLYASISIYTHTHTYIGGFKYITLL